MNSYSNICDSDIAVIGIGCRLPGDVSSPDDFYDKLIKKYNAIQTVPETRWSKSFFDTSLITSDKGGYLNDNEWKQFDSLFFGINPNESKMLDPQQRVLLKCLWESLEDSHIKPESIRGSNTACFIGLTTTDYGKIQSRSFPFLNSYWCHGNSSCFFSNRLSFAYDLRGTSLSIETACSSSMNAIFMGIKALQSGVEDLAVVGGTNCIFDPTEPLIFTQNEMLSKKMGACRSFEDCADGYIRSEGAGIIIMKRANDAIRDGNRIYAIVKGGSSNMDGQNHKDNIIAPSMHAQKENIELALKRSNVNPNDIFMVEAHGTGTPTGDPTEVEAISMVFKDNHSNENPLRIGSVKTNIGHLEACSGVASFIKTCLMLKNRKFIPNINFERINPKIKLTEWNIKVQTELEDFPTDKLIRIGINNFGMSGSNVHLILEEPPRLKESSSSSQLVQSATINQYLVPFSANSLISLESYINKINHNKDSYSKQIQFKDFVKNQCLSKTIFSGARNIVLARDWSELEFDKSIQLVSSTISNFKSEKSIPIIFVFSGQGPQYLGMMKDLFENDSTFRDTVNYCDGLLAKWFGYSILDKINSLPSDSSEINLPINAQPYLFLLQIGLVELYKKWGIIPSIVLGHSFGEVAASYCANIIDLETAVTITYYRATLQNKTVGSGRMLSISISKEDFIKDYSNSFSSLEISCLNSDDSIVVSGSEDQLKLLSDQLQKDNIFSAFLSSPTAFHSSKQESIKDGFFNSDLLNIKYPSGDMKIFFSTHHGNQILNKNEVNAQYIYDNIRNTVQFNKALKSVFNYLINGSKNETLSSNSVFLEISPTPTLAYYIKKSIPSNSSINSINPLVLTSLNKKSVSNLSTFHSTIISMFKHGLDIKFECQFNQDELVDNSWKDSTSKLPRYQWEGEHYFVYPLESKKKLLDGPSTNTLGNKAINGVETYHSIIDTSTKPYAFLKDHKVKGKCLVPGSSYIDNILEIFKGRDILIHNLEFNVPVFLVDGNKYELQTSLIPSSKNEYKMEFYFRLDLNSESWTKVSHGRLTVYPPTPSKTIPIVNLDELKSRCNLAIMTKDQVYKKCSTMGLDYGYHFQHIEYLLIGNNCSFTKLNLKPSTSSLDTKNFLNASIMDSFIHCFITILEGKYELVFECLKNFTLYESNIPSVRPDSVYVYSTIESQRGNNSTGKILVYSENGNLLVSYGSVVVNSLVKNKPIEMKDPSKYLYSIDWQEKDSQINNNNISDSDSDYYIFTLLENNLESINSTSKPPTATASKSLIRILDCSNLDLNNTNRLIEFIKLNNDNDNNNSIIEYTKLLKYNELSVIEELSKINKSQQIKLISTIDKNENLVNQGLMVSSYDLIINSSNDSSIQNNNLNQILSPNGLYIISDNSGKITLAQQKSKINQLKSTKTYNNIIIFSKSNQVSTKLFESINPENNNSLNYYNSSILSTDSNNPELNKIIKSISKSSNKETLIIYSPGLEKLNVDSFKDIAFEYSRLNQIVLDNKLEGSIDMVLLTFNCQLGCSNYFSSSLVGANRYFKQQFSELNSKFIDIDQNTLSRLNLSTIITLSDNSIIGESEFAIRDDKIYVQKIFENPELFKSGNDINLVAQDQDIVYKLNMDLEYIAHTREKELLGDYDVEIKVNSVGVNYKDSLYYRALLPQDIFAKGDVYNPPIGLECSGIISNVGSKSKYQIGDQVVGIVPHSYSTYVITNQDSIVYKPRNITFEQAASVPMVYMSAYYSLYHLGRLENDESVLIHSACGGVGIAALQILRWKNHKGQVFVTIGGHIEEKKKYLLNNYGDIITKVFSTETSSVSKRFSDRIKSINGKGVDVILNTLSGEFMKYNFDSLSEIGRIMDLSMTQLIDNDNLDLEMFKYNVGYNTIDIERTVRFNPKVTNRILKEIFNAIENNQLSTGPIKEFSVLNIKEAIDYVNNRAHIGKIVVNFTNFNQMLSKSNITIKPNFKLNSLGSTLLITGQTGISPVIIKWIIKHSPNHLNNIIVLSKSEAKWEIQKIINQSNNIKIHYRSVDISNYKLLKESINEIYSENPSINPVESIIHLATVYEYGQLSDISTGLLNRTFDPKVVGAFNLYELSKELNWKLNQLLLFSSVASITGMENQLAYSSANCVLDSFANYLNSSGYCNAKSISWGALDSSGEAANNRSVSTFLRSQGYEFVKLSKILGGIYTALHYDTPSHFIISKFRYPLFLESNKHMKSSMGHLVDSNIMELKQQQDQQDNLNENSTDSISNKLVNYIADLLSINPSKLNLLISLKSFGIDSLLTVQLKGFISSQFNISFTHLQLSTSSIQSIIQKIQNNN